MPKAELGIDPNDPDRLQRGMQLTDMMRELERVNLVSAVETMRQKRFREAMEDAGRLL